MRGALKPRPPRVWWGGQSCPLQPRLAAPQILLLLAAQCAFALNPALDISQYAHASWKISDGFPKGIVNAIAQTPDGYLWLGTEFGLVRFDGVRHVDWTPPAGEPLPSNDIGHLLVSHDGTLWIGTRRGLASWKSGRLTRYAQLADQSTGRLVEDREGMVWVGGIGFSSGRLCAIQTGKVQCYGEDGRFGAGVLSLYEYRGDLWAGALTGLWRWKPGPPKLYPVPGRPNPTISDLIEGDNGALYIATPEGIQQFINGKFEADALPAGGQFPTNMLFRDREGSLWIGTRDQGLWHVHQGKVDRFTSADGLSGDRVHRVFEDREGNIWASTTEGLDRFREFAVSTISFKQGLASASVTSVLAAKDGSVWVGTSDGLTRWKTGQFTIYRKSGSRQPERPALRSAVHEITDSGLPDNYTFSLFEDARGRIWVSTRRGVAWFEDGRFIPVARVPGADGYSIVEDSAESIWINDRHVGLVHLLDGRVAGQIPWTTFGPKYSAPARVTADHAKGGLWVGFAQGGVVSLRDGQIGARYTAAQGLGEGSVYDLRVDPDGTLWTATEGGLSRLKDGRIATLTKRNGLPCDTVYWTIEDDARSLWLYMPCGLVSITRAELERVDRQSQSNNHADGFRQLRRGADLRHSHWLQPARHEVRGWEVLV
jgi:ligand-binding sensor domain-containing protein